MKSVQRGDVSKSIRIETGKTTSFTIPISTVNPSKACVVGYIEYLSYDANLGANLALTNANIITVTLYSDATSGTFDAVGSWQVIEFY